MDDIIFDNFIFEVIEPGGVSTEGTNLGEPYSKATVIFNAIPSAYSALSIKFREDPFPIAIYEQFQAVRYATGGQINPTIYHSTKLSTTTKEVQAYNYYMALIGGNHINDEGDLVKDGIRDLFNVVYVPGTNYVTITALTPCVKFETLLSPNPYSPIPSGYLEYTISSSSMYQQVVTYIDELGDAQEIRVGGVGGYDQQSFIALIGSVNVTGSEYDLTQSPSTEVVTVNYENQDCSEPLPSLTGTMTLAPAVASCTHVKVSMLTSRVLTDIKTPVAVYPNADNPFEFDVLRGNLLTNFSGAEVQNGPLFSKQFYSPAILDVNKFVVSITNKSNSATIIVTNSIVQSIHYPLVFQYKIGIGQWTSQSSFDVPLGASYTLYVKDQYGCQISTPFTVTGYQDVNTTVIQKTFCGDLHELNVGKFLNLFGKQHTMKLGFVCNASAKDVKIFKHIQMLLNVKYAVKNINVKTSRDQERFIPGEHLNYRIREGQHSVPLKNPRDYDDLRGNWSYLEIEIESINNSKVDLFSVMMYLRKSTI